MATSTVQLDSLGDSSAEIHASALRASDPQPALTWLDVGCGRGDVLRAVSAGFEPTRLAGVDVIDWLADDLRDNVEMIVSPAEDEELPASDRVLMIEVIEHLEAPWRVLRTAARAVAPGGRLVVTTPSVTNLRHRAELLLRGTLTSFRPDNRPHLAPALPHVIERIVGEEGLVPTAGYIGRDIVPNSGGRLWPHWIHRRAPQLTSVSLAVTAVRPLKPS